MTPEYGEEIHDKKKQDEEITEKEECMSDKEITPLRKLKYDTHLSGGRNDPSHTKACFLRAYASQDLEQCKGN